MLSVPFLSASCNIYEYVEEHWAWLQFISSIVSGSIILWTQIIVIFCFFFFF